MEKIKSLLKKWIIEFEAVNMRRAQAIVQQHQKGLRYWD